MFACVGTVLFNMAVNPVTKRLYVTLNTEARNEVRFEGTRPPSGPGSTFPTVLGRQHQTRITVIDPLAATVQPRHLNKHINYAVSLVLAHVRARSLALPRGLRSAATGRACTWRLPAPGRWRSSTLRRSRATPTRRLLPITSP